MPSKSATDLPSTDTQLATAAAVIVASRAEKMLSLRDAPLNPDDVEAVHDLRVASRRFRTVLEMFEPCFDGKAQRRAVRTARNLTHSLGTPRDLDVQIATLRPIAVDAAAADRVGIDALIASRFVLRAQSQELVPGVLAKLDDPRFLDDLQTLARPRSAKRSKNAAGSPRLKRVDPAASLRDNAVLLLDQRAKRLQKKASAALVTGATVELHAARIAAKQLRYAIHAVGFCFADELWELHEHTRTIQDILGGLHDCDVLAAAIEGWTRSRRDADATALAALGHAGAKQLNWSAVHKAPHRREYQGLARLQTLIAARRELFRLRFADYWRPLDDGALRAMLRSATG